MKKRIAISVLLSALMIHQANANCPLTKAIYAYGDAPSIAAKFLPLKHQSLTDVYFTITSSKGQELWFTLDWGNGFTTERLVSSKTNPANKDWKPQDPDTNKDRLISDLDYYVFDNSLNVLSGKVKDGDNAPEYVFIPSLAPTLWYSRNEKVFSDYQLNRAMFTLIKCEQ